LKFNLLYIVCRAWVALLPLLLALASAKAQTVVYEGVTTQLNINAVAGNTYAWKIYNDATLDFSLESSPGCPVTSANFTTGNTGSSVQVKWLKPGIYFYKVTANDATQCAMNLKVGMITVLPIETKAVITGATITGSCRGVNLSASNSIGVNYEWSLVGQGGVLSTTTGLNTEFKLTDTYDGPLPANFQVRLLVSDLSGHSDNTIVTIKVDQPPHANAFISGQYEADGTMLADGKFSTGTTLNYNWYTTGGDIVGVNNHQSAKLYGTGTYTLKVTDAYNCLNEYSFPLKFDQIIAVRDYARISWAQDTIISVLDNDNLPDDFITSKVRITHLPSMGNVLPNDNGTVTYRPRDKVTGHDQFVYEVCDAVGNCSSAPVNIDIYDSPIFIPEGFSPNGDGKNDMLVFEGIDKYPKSQLTVFTRTGEVVYKSDDYQNDWDGTYTAGKSNNFDKAPTGTYYYVLKLGDTNRTFKSFIFIGY